jgi:trk system potassium uptake protein TrkH
MILSGINYVAYFYLITGKIKEIFKVEEIRWYLGIILTSAVVIAVNIRSLYGSWEETFRHSFFQVGTIITTTGYATTNFDLWPSLSKFILVLLMIVGACAGSTGGGMKVSRWIILTKSAIKELSLVVHPHAVKKIRMDNRAVPHNVLRSTNTYFVIYFMTLMASVLLISIDNFDFETNFTAVAATLNNIGPGLAKVGPTMNFFNFSAFSKVIMMFDMLAGRLELFPIMILFFPQAWRKH